MCGRPGAINARAAASVRFGKSKRNAFSTYINTNGRVSCYYQYHHIYSAFIAVVGMLALFRMQSEAEKMKEIEEKANLRWQR